MELSIQSLAGTGRVEIMSVLDAVFSTQFNEPLVHQVITTYLTKGRSGTKAQKTRAEVNASKNKPWRQKGTGRARAGSFTSPLWRGGGVIFAAKPTDYFQKLNKKMYRGALRSILSEMIRQQRLVVVDNLIVTAPKTRELLKQFEILGLKKDISILVLVANQYPNLGLAARNLYRVQVREVTNLDPVSLIKFEKILITVPALKKIEESLS